MYFPPKSQSQSRAKQVNQINIYVVPLQLGRTNVTQRTFLCSTGPTRSGLARVCRPASRPGFGPDAGAGATQPTTDKYPPGAGRVTNAFTICCLAGSRDQQLLGFRGRGREKTSILPQPERLTPSHRALLAPLRFDPGSFPAHQEQNTKRIDFN